MHTPVVLTLAGPVLGVRNRYHTADTAHLRVVAAVVSAEDGSLGEETVLDVPVLAPGASASVALPDALVDGADGGWWDVRVELADDQPWAPAGHVLGRVQAARPVRTAVRPVLPRPAALPALVTSAAPLTLGPATFDPRTGRLTRLHGLDVDGPRLELWRAPTDNDRGASFGSYETATPEETPYGTGEAGPSSEQRWRARGLDRLVHRLLDLRADETSVVSTVRVGTANSGLSVEVRTRWQRVDGGLGCFVDVVPSTGWDCTWPRVGVRLDLPATVERAAWFGTGPAESYPDTRTAARVGRFDAGLDELSVPYSRPQETGHRSDLRHLELSGPDGVALRLRTAPDTAGRLPGFTLSRHTPQQVDRAPHPHELPAGDRTYLFVDAAVHGVGSRACGPDVLPQHALWPGAHQLTLVFEDLGLSLVRTSGSKSTPKSPQDPACGRAQGSLAVCWWWGASGGCRHATPDPDLRRPPAARRPAGRRPHPRAGRRPRRHPDGGQAALRPAAVAAPRSRAAAHQRCRATLARVGLGWRPRCG